MANEKEIFGLPKVDINFKTQATTAIARSSRGIGVLILNDENAFDDNGNEEIKYFKIESTTDIPDSGINEKNIDLIKKALLGTPLRLHVYLIPPETYNVTSSGTTVTSSATTTQADVLKKVADVKFNYIAHSTGKSQDQQDLASWVKSQRQNKKKTFKAVVANYDADSYSVINFTTEKIRVENPAYVDALKEVDGDAALVPSTIPQYLTYSATEYTARILGILAGLPLDRSATFFILSEVVDVAEYDDIDVHISGGELCLFDAKDDNGVREYLENQKAGHDERFTLYGVMADPDTIGGQQTRFSVDNVWFNDLDILHFSKNEMVETEMPFGFTPEDVQFQSIVSK